MNPRGEIKQGHTAPVLRIRVLKARRVTAWGFQPQVKVPTNFGRAEGTQAIGMERVNAF